MEKILILILFISVVSFIIILNLKKQEKKEDTRPRLINKAIKDYRKKKED